MLCCGRTDIGKRREYNQDTFICETFDNGMILSVVCDGMGGAAAGGLASGIACGFFIESISPFLEKFPRREKLSRVDERQIKAELDKAARYANETVYSKSTTDKSLKGMGTTIVAVLATEHTVFTVNIGDSRAYVYDGKSIKQITHDHSYVQYLVDTGKLTKEQAKTSPNKNIITRAVGTDLSVEADVSVLRLQKKTHKREYAILLCSDGLSNMLEENELAEALRGVCLIDSSRGLGHRCETLIDMANDAGGYDNITAVLLTI